MRDPRYESLDGASARRPVEYASHGGEERQAVDIGRPRGAAARVTGHSPDAATRQAWAELAEISDAEFRAMKLRMMELQAG